MLHVSLPLLLRPPPPPASMRNRDPSRSWAPGSLRSPPVRDRRDNRAWVAFWRPRELLRPPSRAVKSICYSCWDCGMPPGVAPSTMLVLLDNAPDTSSRARYLFHNQQIQDPPMPSSSPVTSPLLGLSYPVIDLSSRAQKLITIPQFPSPSIST